MMVKQFVEAVAALQTADKGLIIFLKRLLLCHGAS